MMKAGIRSLEVVAKLVRVVVVALAVVVVVVVRVAVVVVVVVAVTVAVVVVVAIVATTESPKVVRGMTPLGGPALMRIHWVYIVMPT